MYIYVYEYVWIYIFIVMTFMVWWWFLRWSSLWYFLSDTSSPWSWALYCLAPNTLFWFKSSNIGDETYILKSKGPCTWTFQMCVILAFQYLDGLSNQLSFQYLSEGSCLLKGIADGSSRKILEIHVILKMEQYSLSKGFQK